MSKNVPVDKKLWAEIQALAKGESDKPVKRGQNSVNPVNEGKGFKTFPSAYANGWALAQYKRLGGKWKKEGSEYEMPRKWDKEHCESKTCDEMGFSEKASCRPYKNCYSKSAGRVAERYAAKRDDPKMKNTGKGGLGTWFAGHGGGNPDDRATWGDWIAVTPVKHTITKEDGEKKTYEPGDIVGPCAVSSEKEWADVTSGGKKPLKCMPREKAWGMSKEERAQLAKKKRREEAKHRGQKPVNTPTFSEEAKEITKKARLKKSDFFREVTPPDELTSFSNGTPISKDTDIRGQTHSSLPNGETARNIGRPSPDSPNLKYKNLDRSESYGRTPAEGQDFGYVHDSGSGSARVIPYDSGFANNSSVYRSASGRYVYHGSPFKLAEITPKLHYLSNKPLVFGSSSFTIALTLIASWDDSEIELGEVDKDTPYLMEKYKGAFDDIFRGTSGYIYTLDARGFRSALTKFEMVSTETPKIKSRVYIPDVLQALKESEIQLISFDDSFYTI
jgi:hypothetical protein